MKSDIELTNGRSRDGRLAIEPRREVDINDFTIGELLKQLTQDASHLAQQEVALAKAEVRESVSAMQKAAVSFGLAAAVALPGIMALTAFFVIVLSNAFDSWAIGSIVVAVVLLAVAGLMVQRARAALQKPALGLPETRASLARDAAWGKQEMRAFKEELTA